MIGSIGDLAPGLTFLISDLDSVVDADSQQIVLFGTNHFDSFLKFAWPASGHCFHQVREFILATFKLHV
ncbi:hypothetical protein CR64_06430 [Pseudomonas aeruginosa]|nr:hypothetical protein CR64_06430 [Pseudomonas aeruginosa]KSG68610.1 hypothetical protein AO961_27505 [Pseudomonas aeruginosa]